MHYLDAWRYTAWFNLLQNPAVSVPVHRSPEGLPIGVQVVTRPWEEPLRASGCTDHRAVARRVGGAAGAVRVERLPKHRRG